MDLGSTLFSMGKNRRSRTEIFAIIMTIAQNETSRAEIMEKAGLNSKQWKRYLDELIHLGFVEVKRVNKHRVYATSEKGNQFLRQYHTLAEFTT